MSGFQYLGEDWSLIIPSSQNSWCNASTSHLVALPILPAWLLANQYFIKDTRDRIKDHCPTASKPLVSTNLKGCHQLASEAKREPLPYLAVTTSVRCPPVYFKLVLT